MKVATFQNEVGFKSPRCIMPKNGKSKVRQGQLMPFYKQNTVQFTIPASFPTAGEGLDVSMRLGADALATDVHPREAAFKKQKEMFLAKAEREPLFLAPYQGKFVISCDGVIQDSDIDLPTLTKRFFGQPEHRNTQVYITQVEPLSEEAIITPFFE